MFFVLLVSCSGQEMKEKKNPLYVSNLKWAVYFNHAERGVKGDDEEGNCAVAGVQNSAVALGVQYLKEMKMK